METQKQSTGFHKNLLTMLYVILAVVVIEAAIMVYMTASTSVQLHSMSQKLSNLTLQVTSLNRANTTPAAISYFANNAPFGSRLTNISQPISAAQLSVINNAPNSYFEQAGEMLLHGNINNQVSMEGSDSVNQFPAFVAGGKPSVIYIGATSCIFCGENRWAMALALSRFGNFSNLYIGYSSLGDGDVPTIYWTADNYTTSSGMGYGNSYTSNYINFISADYESPITSGFQLGPLQFFINNSPNTTYTNAMSFMNGTNQFQGTPFTFWGTTLLRGADAVVLGNSTPTGSTLPLTYETHAQIFNQLNNFSDQFSWSEYAAADVYGAYVCSSINNTAEFCTLPSIIQLESDMNLTTGA